MAGKWKMLGQYLKTCSCDPGCPCDFWADPTHHVCEGFNAMHIVEGHFDKVKLDGLSWAISYHFPGPLHEGHGIVQPYVDQRATAEQRNALLTIMSGKAGCAWFEVVASLVSTVLTPKFVPIQFQFNLKKRTGKCIIPGEAEVITEPIRDIGGNEVRARIDLPKGIEYSICEVAASKVLKSTGPIQFNRAKTHSSFSDVTYTHKGLKD
jgi:hypothetical protein